MINIEFAIFDGFGYRNYTNDVSLPITGENLYTEELDEFQIKLLDLEKQDFKPLQKTRLIIDGVTQYFLIEDIKETQTTFDDTPLYDYELGLIELTKQTERDTTPNTSSTQPLTGTKKTLKDVVEKELQIQTPLSNDYSMSPKYTLDTDSAAYLDNYIAPEFTWSGFTLWEKLKEVGEVSQGIPRLLDGDVIKYDFLDTSTDTIDDGDYYANETFINVDSYATALETQVENLQEVSGGENTIVFPYNNGWITPRSVDNSGEITNDNAVWKFDFPIERNIETTVTGIYYEVTIVDSTLASHVYTYGRDKEYNITEFVKEEKDWQILDNERVAFDVNSGVVTDFEYTKANTIQYTQGESLLFGLGYEAPAFLNWGTPSFTNMMDDIIQTQAYFDYITDPNKQEIIAGMSVTKRNTNKSEDLLLIYKDVMLRNKYETLTNARFRIYDDNVRDLDENTLIFNQAAQVVSNENIANNMKAKINRLSKFEENKIYQVEDYNDLPKLGAKTSDGRVLTKINQSIDNAYISYSVELNQDYNSINKPATVNSQYRQWNVPENNVVDRQDLWDEFILVGNDRNVKDDSLRESSLTNIGLQVMVNTFQSGTIDTIPSPITNANILTYDELGSFVNTLKLATNNVPFANTLLTSFSFEDNFNVGSKADRITDTDASDKDKEQINELINVPYSTEEEWDGEIRRIEARFNTLGTDYARNTEAQNDTALDNYNSYPNNYEFINSNLTHELDINIYKDAREAYTLGIQHHYLPKDSNIQIFNGIAAYSGLGTSRFDGEGNKKFNVIPVLLEFGYKIGKFEKYVDTTKITKFTDYRTVRNNETGIDDDLVKIQSFIDLPTAIDTVAIGQYDGIAYIVEETNELILANYYSIFITNSTKLDYELNPIWFTSSRSAKKV